MALSTTFTQYALEITQFGKNNAKMAISPFRLITLPLVVFIMQIYRRKKVSCNQQSTLTTL